MRGSEFKVQSSKSAVAPATSQRDGVQGEARRTPAFVRYATIYAALWKNSVAREMGFKVNFLLWIVVELLWFALQLTFMAVVYQHTDHIGDWTKWEVVLLVGASHFIQQVFQAFFLTNVTQLSELVRTGRLDFMLLLPVNTRFIVSARQVDLGGFVNAGSAAVVMVYALVRLGIVPGAAQIAGFLSLVVAGVLIHYSLMFLLASVSFWTVRAQGIVWGYYSLFNVARLPDEAVGGFFKVFFTFAVPMLLVANVPARLLADKLNSPFQMLLVVVMCLACQAAAELGWRFALRHYTSASS
ncbi:MAG: ABC-2 family transporter protein [Verrucomicrobia bacterium]|nr:ABC-2 family transporter protein [Verrucomicrobiota bacterium]